MTIYCYKCGMDLPDEALFCARCGTPTTVVPADATSEVEEQAQSEVEESVQPEAEEPVQPEGEDLVQLEVEQAVSSETNEIAQPETESKHAAEANPASYGYTLQRQRPASHREENPYAQHYAQQQAPQYGQHIQPSQPYPPRTYQMPTNSHFTGGADTAAVKPPMDRNRKIAIGIGAIVAAAALLVLIVLIVTGAGPFHKQVDQNLNSTPAAIGQVRNQYELQEVKADGSTSTLLSLKIDNNSAIELTNGDVTISGKLVQSSKSNGSTIYKVEDLRGGGTKLLKQGDSLMLMLPDGAETGQVAGTWRMTIGKSGSSSYQTIWATVNQDGTAMIGSSDNNGFMSNWSANVGESITQTWTQEGDGLYMFTDKNGNQLRVRLA